jgi:hypothetical protein
MRLQQRCLPAVHKAERVPLRKRRWHAGVLYRKYTALPEAVHSPITISSSSTQIPRDQLPDWEAMAHDVVAILRQEAARDAHNRDLSVKLHHPACPPTTRPTTSRFEGLRKSPCGIVTAQAWRISPMKWSLRFLVGIYIKQEEASVFQM